METIASTQILVVEDDENDSFLLTRQLAQAQIDDHATVVRTGKEAIDLLLRSPKLPLAVFLDLKLPGLSGIGVLEKIRSEVRLQALPVIIMTGSIDPRDVERCNRLGVTAFLHKPIALATFIKTVAHLFPKSAREKESA